MTAFDPAASGLEPRRAEPTALEKLAQPVLEGLEKMVRAELETRDYGRWARAVNLINQAKAIDNVARAPRTLADLDDGGPGLDGMAYVPRVAVGGGFGGLGGLGIPTMHANDILREVVDQLKRFSEMNAAKAEGEARLATARELEVLIQASAACADVEKRRRLDARIDALLAPKPTEAGLAPEERQSVALFQGGPNVPAGPLAGIRMHTRECNRPGHDGPCAPAGIVLPNGAVPVG